MDDNPYETPSTTATPPTDGIDTQRFHRNDYLSAGCSFVVVLPLMLFPLGGVVAMLGSHPGESPLRAAVIIAGIVVGALVLASLSAWQALYQSRRRRLRRVGRMRAKLLK